MNRWSLIRATLWHDRRTHLGVVLGVMIATAVLVGALSLGDSLRQSLRAIALQRLGQTTEALLTGDRYFRQALAEELMDQLGDDLNGGWIAPAIMTHGTAADPAGTAPSVAVRLLGVDERFWQLGRAAIELRSDEVALNRYSAERLGAAVGDVLVVRFDKPATLPADAVLGDLEDRRGSMRVRVAMIVDDDNLGRFDLEASGQPVANAFVALPALAGAMDQHGRANLLLVGGERASSGELDGAQFNRALAARWRIEDIGLSVTDLGDGRGYQLQSRHVFLPDHVRYAVERPLDGQPILGYLANELMVGDRRVPYAIVAGMPDEWFASFDQGIGSELEGGIKSHTIWLNDWAADEQDLAATVGDELTMRYYIESADSRLAERSASFRIGRIVPMGGRFVDRELMPPFAGIADAEHHADWNPGVSIDLGRIRPRDEKYWRLYRGTPRAFIAIDVARDLWGNRFGDCTAIRFDASRFASVDDASRAIGAQLDPAQFGWMFQPVRRQALAAAGQGPARYFGGLFTGLSLFLIGAAVMLTAMLFVFGVEQRGWQVGLLVALGFTGRQVRRLLVAEGAVLALLGSLLGIAAALGYAQLMLLALRTVWADAVGSTPINFHAKVGSMVGGAAIAWLASVLAIMLSTWRLMRTEPAQLLRAPGAHVADLSSRRAWYEWPAATICLAGALVLAAWGHDATADMQAAGFIGAGALTLIAALLLVRRWLSRLAEALGSERAVDSGVGASGAAMRLTWAGLSWRAVGRRAGRSLTVITVLATGLFLTLAIGANRKAPPSDPLEGAGPTGGYQLMVNLTHPLAHRLNQRPDGTADAAWAGSEVLAMRLTSGPQASCDNLNRPAQPRLAGVDSAALAARRAFSFISIAPGLRGEDQSWNLLHADLGPDVLPAIADQPTLVWALGLAPGDGLTFTDERGRTFEVRIVAMLESSVLQGMLLVDESRLLERYPSLEGYGRFLVRRPETDPDDTAQLIARAHADRGPSIVTTTEVMTRFQALENTYVSIFLMLGGLGVALGSLGLGVVVLRQVMDRRGELGLLRAVGFSRLSLMYGVMIEHLGLVAIGLVAGMAATLVALGPALRGGLDVPWFSLSLVLAIILASLIAWIGLAAWWATRGSLLDALRHE
ncbi:MAG: FtsX-like permease family protein [Phycisphaeraceae bacterium]|nr:FtsX-like permease family protein [Phycisphaeraceae bacterium]